MGAQQHAVDRTVLVAGTGRSGTTWLGKILDSSPDLLYRHEPDNPRNFPWFEGIPTRIARDTDDGGLEDAWRRASEETFWHASNKLDRRPHFKKQALRPVPMQIFRRASDAWISLARRPAPLWRTPRWLFREPPEGVPLVWKTVVSNLRLAWIHDHFPGTRIVFILRHAGGFMNSKVQGFRKLGVMEYGNMDRLGPVLLPFDLPAHERYGGTLEGDDPFARELVYWIIANEIPLLALADSPRFHPVVYEDLCARPMETVEGIFQFLEMPVPESTRRFVAASTTGDETGYHAVHRTSTEAAEKWRRELEPERVEEVERAVAGCLLAKYFPDRE